MDMMAAKVKAKGQITVPKKVREILSLHEGDTLVFMSEDGQLTLKKAELVVLEEGYNGNRNSSWNG
jgi:AbrB family looped-hinge helix DNA binding protein